jgi:hypothetical protein
MDPGWKKVGVVAVDSGTIWLGDPCYVLHREPTPPDLGKDWQDFSRRTFEREEKAGTPGVAQFQRHHSEEGYCQGWEALGVTVSTGYGDGVYPVEVRRSEDGRIAEVRIVFIKPKGSEG